MAAGETLGTLALNPLCPRPRSGSGRTLSFFGASVRLLPDLAPYPPFRKSCQTVSRINCGDPLLANSREPNQDLALRVQSSGWGFWPCGASQWFDGAVVISCEPYMLLRLVQQRYMSRQKSEKKCLTRDCKTG
jgi:hypothetical protein